MPLIDDLQLPLDEEERGRRLFLGMLGASAMSVAGLGTAVTAVRYLWPEVLFEEQTRFVVGRADDIPPETVVVLPLQKVFVVHAAAGFYALSATCTHLGCMTRYERDASRILCPCHGSQFGIDGQVTGGPAPAPLPRLRLALENGMLIVDLSRVAEGDGIVRS